MTEFFQDVVASAEAFTDALEGSEDYRLPSVVVRLTLICIMHHVIYM